MTRTLVSQIEVLGSVRAWRGDREIPLGPPQQRGVLVLLVVATGRGVPMRSLIEGLWNSHPPASAVNIIRTYVKRLRRLLDPDRPTRQPSEVLPTVGDGYALHAGTDTVDAWRFRELLGQAREARRTGDHARVLTLLSKALQLWHGAPASDLPALTGHPSLRSLASERYTAVGWLAEAALATGQPAEALGAVEEAAAASPLDEPVHAHLIRLYQAVGRRSDGVRAYQQVRCGLRDELGLDPGPMLVTAYRELLRDSAVR